MGVTGSGGHSGRRPGHVLSLEASASLLQPPGAFMFDCFSSLQPGEFGRHWLAALNGGELTAWREFPQVLISESDLKASALGRS